MSTGSRTGSLLSQGAGTGTGTRTRTGNGTGTGTSPLDSNQDSPISKKGVFNEFLCSLTEDTLDKSIHQLDGYAIQNDVSLSNIIVSIPHVPSSPTLSFTATDLFNVFSVS